MLHEKIIFHLDDTIVVPIRIYDHLIEDRGIDVPLLFSELLEAIEFSALYDLESLWYIHLDRLISPEVSCSFYFLLREGVIYEVGKCIIEVKRTHTRRKEFPECSIGFHARKYLFGENPPLFLSILLIQYAVGLILETDTAETE
jgi:hypothetical protein